MVENESKNTTSKSTWNDFQKAGLTPSLDGIEVFGRAITPPHRHKRFDAWFFIKNIETRKGYLTFLIRLNLEDVAWFTLRANLGTKPPTGNQNDVKSFRGVFKL